MGHTITRESGEKLSKDLRHRRFQYERQRGKQRVILDSQPILHFKAPGGGIPAFNTGSGAMGSASCTVYKSSDSGVLTSTSETRTIYNAAGAVTANAWGIAALNEAGLWVVIVERCVSGA